MFIFNVFALIAATAMVSAQDDTNVFASFNAEDTTNEIAFCATGFIQRITTSVSAGEIIGLEVTCNDGNGDSALGASSQFQDILGDAPEGIASLQIRAGERIDAFGYGGLIFGGDGGDLNEVAAPEGQVLQGITVTSDFATRFGTTRIFGIVGMQLVFGPAPVPAAVPAAPVAAAPDAVAPAV